MIKWLSSRIRLIVGRIKKVNKIGLFVTIATVFLPLSVFMLIESPSDIRWLALAMFFTSIALLVTSSILVIQAEKKDKAEKEKTEEKSKNQFSEIVRNLGILHDDLQKLNKDKEGNKDDKPTDQSML